MKSVVRGALERELKSKFLLVNERNRELNRLSSNFERLESVISKKFRSKREK